ncbi:MAG: alpha-amylase family protein, partial [Anaerolineae bacterium]
AAEFAQTLKDAHVAYVNAFARCNIGFAYYPTKVGIPYPGMKGDMFGDLLRECHQRDIGVSAYINVGLDHEQSSRNMGWLRLDRDGRVVRGDRTGNFFRELCYNNPEYRAYHFAMLREICAYDPDGYFLDCMVVEPCYCYHCLSKMKNLGIDADDTVANCKFQEASMVAFSEESVAIIGEGKYVYLNGMHYVTVQGMDTQIEIECLPSGWGYDIFWPHVSYARNIQENVLYMTGRFQTNWGDFGGFKTKESLEHDYYDALCAGVGVSIGDHMHPARNLDQAVYKTIGELNAMVMELEPYTEKARFLAEIGVLINAERDFSAEGFVLTDSHRGLARMFGELRQSFNIINETMSFDKYRLLVLPDHLKMNAAMKARIAAFLAKGGKVLASGTAGLNSEQSGFVLPEWDFEFAGVDKSNASYFHIIDPADPKVCDMDYAMYSDSGTLFKGGRMLAKYVKAYFDRHWDGFHGYFYTPPEVETEYAAAAVSANDNLCHISFEIFRSYYKSAAYANKALVKQCLGILLPDPLIRTQGIPSTARVTATGCSEYTLLHVKVTYPEVRGRMDIIEEHAVLEAGAVVYIKGNYASACTLPEKEPIAIEGAEGGYTRVMLPRIVGYRMILLEN